jgi:hypothetical protein
VQPRLGVDAAQDGSPQRGRWRIHVDEHVDSPER